MSTNGPLLAVDGSDDTAAAVLLDQYRDTVVETVRRTRQSGNEQATVLYGESRDRLTPTPFATGTGTTVNAPSPSVGVTPKTTVQIHSHPPPAPVSFSAQDVRVFLGTVMEQTPRNTAEPSAFAVVGQRGGEVRRGTAYIHSIEPSQTYIEADELTRQKVREQAINTDASPTARAIQLDGDPNTVLAPLARYVRYDRRKFAVPAPAGR